MKIGAHYSDNGHCQFTVWAPNSEAVSLSLIAPQKRGIPMEQKADGYWNATLTDLEPDTLYYYQLDGSDYRPDPASQFQPEGVHGPSQVIDQHSFNWSDHAWSGQSLESMIIYELHIGTFTPEGTLEAIIPRLSDLKALGVNAIELMPIAQFSGDDYADKNLRYRNWGYDGVDLFAVQNSYGGPEQLKNFVDACHLNGISVILDVVYNHFGPEGNYVNHFGPYFTDKYHGEWGDAINFDGSYSHCVRNFFIQNALFWLETYHIDALRLDAVQSIYDSSAKHFLQELAENVERAFAGSYQRYLMAESDLNNAQIMRPVELGGYGLDAQWGDDLHHALYTLLTQEKQGYYRDFGTCEQLAKAYSDSFVYDWQYAPNRGRFHGSPAKDCSTNQFIVFIQNHDQVANALPGERLSKRASFECLKLAAGAILLSPSIPLLFMGEEYGEEVPFTYFVSHSDRDLIEAVRQGRRKQFADFQVKQEVLDPEAVETFTMCKLQWSKRLEGKHQVLWTFYQTLMQMRQKLPSVSPVESDSLIISPLGIKAVHPTRKQLKVYSDESKKLVWWLRGNEFDQVVCLLNFSEQQSVFAPQLPSGLWRKLIDSAEEKWLGQGSILPEKLTGEAQLTMSPQSFALYQQE